MGQIKNIKLHIVTDIKIERKESGISMSTESFLHQTLLQQTASISKEVLKDINWDVRLVLSSDRLSNINEPLVTVTFDVLSESNVVVKRRLEMNKSELKAFIESLE